MKVLLNFDSAERDRLPGITSILKQYGLIGLATPKVLAMSELLDLAKRQEVSAILCANEGTLQHLVASGSKKKVTLAGYRGSRLNFSIPVIVLNSLEHLNTVTYGRFLAEIDVGKVCHVGKPVLQVPFKVCETDEDFAEAEQRLAACEIVSIDIETSESALITCVSFTGLVNANTTISYVIPLIDFGLDHWPTEAQYAKAIQAMQRICGSNVPKMMFNATYDASYLIKYHAWPRNLVLDVMGFSHSEYSELPKTLDFVASRTCYDYYFWKHESDAAFQKKDIRAYWHYCVKDSWFTLRAGLHLMKNAASYTWVNYQHMFKLTYPSIYCHFEGWKVDNDERQRLRDAAEAELQKALADLRTISNCATFNPGSPPQVATLLYDILGARKVKGKNSKGEVKDRGTDEKTLNRVAEQHPILAIVVDRILKYREKSKAISTYFDFEQINERLMYSLGPFGTETSRFACRASVFYAGTQVQNIPSYAKGMLVADEGYSLIEPDNNKSEARCVAYQAKCAALKKALEDREKDFYRALGTIFFGIPYEQVTKELRNKVLKRIVHGTNYVMGADTFILNVGPNQLYEGAGLLGLTVYDLREFATYLLEIYHKKFPEVRVGYGETRREILATHKLVSELGTVRYFFGDISKNHKVFRGAVAHKPQHLSVMILNKGFWRVYKELVIPSNGEFRLKAQIHDSLPSQAIDSKREYYAKEMVRCMDNPVRVCGDILSIPVDYKFGKTWLELKD